MFFHLYYSRHQKGALPLTGYQAYLFHIVVLFVILVVVLIVPLVPIVVAIAPLAPAVPIALVVFAVFILSPLIPGLFLVFVMCWGLGTRTPLQRREHLSATRGLVHSCRVIC
eukprot:gnl/TRDRNA2_/TRDRNA2_37736_c1_seq1.p1 gnl/TRDRNA2_/TRDRNA2_37736_c1~~gnl/TRDRNA2_/TRDRNA2_37736_c1_seq1.p1  ORF type:complete len:112 (+),score=5.74 gnl/TRDRNA2_/TRDRNA2_37736_c1_seq1:48-383(+)